MERISILKGPDRVRKRPAVIFSSDDIQGVENAVRPILELFATEAKLGHCKHLTVTQNINEVTIAGDDRGIILGDGVDDHVWKSIFCEIFAGPRTICEDSSYSFSFPDMSHTALFGEPAFSNDPCIPESIGFLDLCAAQYASSFMNVDVVRDGVRYSLVFKKGCNVGGLQHEPMNRHSGTTFHFSMDPEVFSETIIPESFFINTLTNIAILSPGLTCIYINSGTGHKRKFHFPRGIADYLKQTTNCAETPLFKACIYASGRDRYNRPEYQADLEIAIGFSEYGCSEKYLHNFRTIRHGGLHVNSIQDRVCRIINDCFHDEIWFSASCASNNDITYGELKDHIHIAVTTFCPSRFSLWESGAQQSLVNPMIADMAYDAVSGKFWAYVHNNRRALLPIINTILEKRSIAQ